MNIDKLRRMGSHRLDDYTEYVIGENFILLYETKGNGIYKFKRSWRVTKMKRDNMEELIEAVS